MLLVSVTVNASNSTIVSEENYCYDQVGDAIIAMNPLKNVYLYGKTMILLKVLVTMKI